MQHEEKCRCKRCESIRRKSRALELVQSRMNSSSEVAAMMNMLRSSETDHTETVRKSTSTQKSLLLTSLKDELRSDSRIFFPRDFKSFLLTGNVPKIKVTKVQERKKRKGPVFVLGCGRSGTTILSSILSHIPGAVFLNEPRVLWINALESFDVWSTQSDRRQGTLRLDAKDVSEISASFLHNAHLNILNATSQREASNEFILEKFPEHAFKIPALLRIFPDAKFIHIIRNPHDVASSIGSFEEHTWFGATGRKWSEICKIAIEKCNISRDVLVSDVKDDLVLRGLLEWTVAMHTIENDVASIWPSDKCTQSKHFLELKYEDLVSDPVRIVRLVSRFITQRNECDKDLELFASSSIKKSSEKKKRRKDILNFIQSNKFIQDMASQKGY